MKTRLVGLGLLGAVIGGTGAVTACDDAAPTEIIGGVSTQIEVPKYLSHVVIQSGPVNAPNFCHVYPVYDGKVELPRSLGVQKITTDATIEIAIYAFSLDGVAVKGDQVTEDSLKDGFSDCIGWDPSLAVGGNAPANSQQDQEKTQAASKLKLMKRFRSGYLPNHIIFAPLALRYSCYNVICPAAQTCQAGQCLPVTEADPSTEPDFQPGQTDGTGPGCFDPLACFAAAVQPAPIDPVNATCTYRVPTFGQKVTSANLNVRAVFQGDVTEVLDADKDEGYTIVAGPASDPNGIYFQLATGLCSKTAPHPIVSLAAGFGCPTKTPLQPICNDETRILQPARNAVYVLIDGTDGLRLLRGAPAATVAPTDDAGTGDAGPADDSGAPVGADAGTISDGGSPVQTALGSSLQDPVFDTTIAEYAFVPENPNNPTEPLGVDHCSIRAPSLNVTHSDAFQVANSIVEAFPASGSRPLPPGPPPFAAALTKAYATLDADPFNNGFAKKAVVIITGSDLTSDPSECAGPKTAAQEASDALTKNISTYVVPLSRADAVISSAVNVATSGGTLNVYDPKTNPLLAFTAIVSDLSTCVYDNNGDTVQNGARVAGNFIDATGTATVRFSTPAGVQTLPFDPACTKKGAAANGWGVAGGFLYVCGTACDTIKAAHAAALISQLPAGDHPSEQFIVSATPAPRAAAAK